MTFPCYIPRSSPHPVVGAVFVTPGVRWLIPDHWLLQVELSEQGKLLRLSYTGSSVEVAGQALETLFNDATVGRLGTILQGPPTWMPSDRPWVSSIVAIAPGGWFGVWKR